MRIIIASVRIGRKHGQTLTKKSFLSQNTDIKQKTDCN